VSIESSAWNSNMLSDEAGITTPRRAQHERAKLARLLAAVVASAMFSAISGAAPADLSAFDLARHRGRVVIVDFWASWCKPCRQSIPWLNSMRARYGASGLDVIGVNVDAQRADAERFLRDVPIEFEIIFDPNGDLAKQFKVQGMPSSFVFDRSGVLVETHLGFRDAKKAEHEATLNSLLNHSVE
jgi:thiol-disulfide isomerase/thioredoxin